MTMFPRRILLAMMVATAVTVAGLYVMALLEDAADLALVLVLATCIPVSVLTLSLSWRDRRRARRREALREQAISTYMRTGDKAAVRRILAKLREVEQ